MGLPPVPSPAIDPGPVRRALLTRRVRLLVTATIADNARRGDGCCGPA